MKEIEENEINALLQIIAPAPLLRIGHFSDDGMTLPRCLDAFCAAHGYDYLLNCTSQTYYDHMIQQDNMQPYADTTTIKHFSLERPSYMQHGKFYDYLFVTADIAPSAREAFLQKAHKVIKNAGLILIFVPKNAQEETVQWTALLEEHYFVATSNVDIGQEWRVIISKKMHGWGG